MRFYLVTEWKRRNGGLVPVVRELPKSKELLGRLPDMFRAGTVRFASSGGALIIDRREAVDWAAQP
jgi:hypothetical protein